MTSDATRLICPLTAATLEGMRSAMAQAAANGADMVEIRLDFLDPPPTAPQTADLVAHCPLPTIVTYRTAAQGGRYRGEESPRLAALQAAADAGAAFIDVESDVPPANWPRGRIIVSQHDFARRPGDLPDILARMDASEAAVNKIAFAAAGPEDALAALEGIRACHKPTLAIAMGEPGVASRILAKKFNAFGTFASLDRGSASAPGQPTLQEMRSLYRWDSIGPGTQVFGVIGCPVGHSVSPAIHNAAFAALGLDAVYVPLRIEPGADPFNRFMDALVADPWLDARGLSVTIPHKENALAYVGGENCDELARRIGAINTITIGPGGRLRGDNTDYAAAIDALAAAMGIARHGLAGRGVAILGAGGAARAIVAALAHYGAQTTIYNRTAARGETLASEFSCRAAAMDDAASSNAEIVINCTPVGMHPKTDACPLPSIPPSARVVFDTIYNPLETLLLRLARRQGCITVSGLDMFVNQAVAQFEAWTKTPAPRDVMRAVVLERLGGAR